MDKRKYYVNLQSQEISQEKYQNNDAFTIFATKQEVELLRAKLKNAHDAEVDSFFRAYVPIKPYHENQPDAQYDKNVSEAFEMIYTLGDEQARDFIMETGVLGDRPIDTDR